jgi:hypothetical protein
MTVPIRIATPENGPIVNARDLNPIVTGTPTDVRFSCCVSPNQEGDNSYGVAAMPGGKCSFTMQGGFSATDVIYNQKCLIGMPIRGPRMTDDLSTTTH